MGRGQIALPLAVALVASWMKPAAATVFSLRPVGSFGVTDNPYGISEDQQQTELRDLGLTPGWHEFANVGLSAQLQINETRSINQLACSINRTEYQGASAADNTSLSALWYSSFDLTKKTTLSLSANASRFSYSAIASLDAATANPTGAPLGVSPTTVLSISGMQTLTYVKNERDKYTETFSALRFDPLSSGMPIAATTTLTAIGRADRQRGPNGLSLTLIANDFMIDSSTALPSSFADGPVLTLQVLGGLRRDFNAHSSIEGNAGLLAFYGVNAQSLALGPAFNVTASYKLAPWFASLNVSQQPIVNVYVGEALLADAAVARVALPVDKRETLVLVGIAGYTYARRIAGGEHFIFAPRAYDLFMLDGGLTYRFEELPFFLAADYSVSDQRGSLGQGIYIPNALRRVAMITLGGQLAWGEGNMFWRTPSSGR